MCAAMTTSNKKTLHHLFFSKGDISAFWALFADNLANMVIISAVCLYVFKMPKEIVYGRILPGLGVALIVGLLFYSYIAVRLSRKEKRENVTALPYGLSTPVMFVYLFGIIGPIYWSTNDPIVAWQAGMAAALTGGVIEALGSVIGPALKRISPRAGMLGTLAGIAIVWIATVPMAIIFETPLVGFPSLIIIFIGLVAGVKLPKNFPAGLAAIMVGTAVSFFMIFSGYSQVPSWFAGVGLYLPFHPHLLSDLFAGFKYLPSILPVVLPIEIYNFIETMNNVESAEAAGDTYNVRSCQIMDGVGTMAGALCGAPFPTTVYIGHPAYKRLGARCGYALGVGAVFFLGSLFGLVALFNNVIPQAAVAPMLVFVGIVITGQAFTATPARHAMAVAVAIIPHISDILCKKLYGALQQTGNYLQGVCGGCFPPGTAPADLSTVLTRLSQKDVPQELVGEILRDQGIHLCGQCALANGAIITGLMWGGMTALMIDGMYTRAMLFALGCALLTLTGFMHMGVLGFHIYSPWFYGYLLMALLFYLCHLFKLERHLDAEF
jgi:AGZA family xanthine/uracil permease-like MFS transporter